MKVFGYILLLLSVYVAFIIGICAAGLDLALICSQWDHPPTDWHIRLFGWNGLLIINLASTFIVAGVLFYTLFWLPRRLDQHGNDNGDDASNSDPQ